MFEDSPDAFIARFKPFASEVEVFSRVEGSPLLELRVGDTIVQVLERTGPYLATPGMARIIINPMADAVTVAGGGITALEATGLSRLHGSGLVVATEDRVLVVDVGVPLVIGLGSEIADTIASGDWVTFDTVPPIHGYLVPQDARARRTPDDDLV